MMQRYHFIAVSVLALLASLTPNSAAIEQGNTPDYAVRSPNGEIVFHLHVQREGPLQYEVTFRGRPVIERSRVGILIDGVDLDTNAQVERADRYEIDQKNATRGVHSMAANHCNGAKFQIVNPDTGAQLTLEVRAFDDGIAFRHIVPGAG